MNVNFTQKKELVAIIVACLFAMQPMMAQVFWSEDFANGLPSDWSNIDASDQNAVFAWCSNPASGDPSTGCPLLWEDDYNMQAAFASETAANGFVSVNSDAINAAISNPHITELTTAPIDCSAETTVFLRFEGHIGAFDLDPRDNAIVRVSTDGGNAWTDFPAYPNLVTGNTNPGFERWSLNPEVTIIDITDVAAGQSQVWIQWQWTAGWEYHWSIDDVTLTRENPVPPNDLQINSPLGLFYGIAPNAVTPASQVEPMGFMADVANSGSAEQTNVNLNISIYNDADVTTPVHTADLSYGTIPAVTSVENQFIPGFFTPAAETASYTGTYTISSDQSADDSNPVNNTQDFTFLVSEDLFAKEVGATNFISPAANNWSDGEPHSWVYGNCFYVPNGAGWYVDRVEFGLGNAEEVIGRDVTVWVYKWEDTNGDNQSQDTERTRLGFNTYTISGEEAFDIVTIPVFDFVSQSLDPALENDAYYLVMVEFTSPDDMTDLILLGSRDYDYSAMSFQTDSLEVPRYAGFLGIGTETEYSSTGFGQDIVPVVRMGIRDVVNTEELSEVNLIDVFPNPAKESVTARIELETPAVDLEIQIMDVNGRLMTRNTYQNVQNQQFTFSVNNWTSGTYLMHIITDEGIKTKRFIVQK